jgi:hypothetical protein
LVSQKFYSTSDLASLYQSTASAIFKNQKVVEKTPPSLSEINLSPDFSLASQTISSYLENSLKIKPDFIVAVNNLLFEELLTEENSPSLDSFKTSSFEASGSSAVKDLTTLYLNRLFSHDLSLPVIGRTLAKEVGDNQIYLWSSDFSIEKTLASQSYSGVVTTHPCHTGLSTDEDCLAETSYLAESQAFTGSINPWNSRLLKHTVTLNTNSVNHEYQINYVPDPHASISATVSTIYDLYLSSPSTLNQVYLDNLPYSVKQVTKENVSGLDHYRIPLLLNPGQNHTVNLRLTTQTVNTFDIPNSYSLTEYRQPGTTDPGITLIINYPGSMRVSILTQPANTSASALNLVLPLHTTTFGLSLVKNLQ